MKKKNAKKTCNFYKNMIVYTWKTFTWKTITIKDMEFVIGVRRDKI